MGRLVGDLQNRSDFDAAGEEKLGVELPISNPRDVTPSRGVALVKLARHEKRRSRLEKVRRELLELLAADLARGLASFRTTPPLMENFSDSPQTTETT